MKDVDFLVIHSTDTSEALDLKAKTVIDKHTTDKRSGGFGWNRPGFDYLVLQDGTLETIIPEHSPTEVDLWGISQGRFGISGNVKNIAYVGGRTLKEAWWKDTRTEEQTATLEAVVKFYTIRFPEIIIVGFNEIATKKDSDKPGFSVKEWLEELDIPKCNIYQGYQ